MHVVMFRSWDTPAYAASFSTLARAGVGGTELQLLLHARALRDAGHRVTVVGATPDDRVEEGVEFLAGRGRGCASDLPQAVGPVDVVLTNDTSDVALLRRTLQPAQVVQVCQNGPDLDAAELIDLYAMVGPGQHAYYSARRRRHRHKFVMLPNVVPWETAYRALLPVDQEDVVTWVGGLGKQGLRRWGIAMSEVMRDYPTLQWVLCAPSYDLHAAGLPDALAGLALPLERLHFRNLRLAELGQQLQRSRAVLTSLGGEDGPVSYQDGHALGVPVLSGDDIIAKYANPEGAGLRCRTARDCSKALRVILEDPEGAKRMGRLASSHPSVTFLTESDQAAHLRYVVDLLELRMTGALPNPRRLLHSDRKFGPGFIRERAAIKYAERRPRRSRRAEGNDPR